MVKSCVNFRNSLFVCFFECCFYLVFTLQKFGSLAPLIYFFYQNLLFLMKRCICFVFTNIRFFQNTKLSFIKTITFNIKQFNISMGYNLNFLSSNVNGLNSSKNELKCVNTLGRKSQIME